MSETVLMSPDYQVSKSEIDYDRPSIEASSKSVTFAVANFTNEFKIKVTEVYELEYQDESILQDLSEICN